MWFLFTLITFCCWGIADLFYKLGNKEEYSHVKTGIIVGLVMGLHAIIYLVVNKVVVLDKIKCPILLSVPTVSISELKRFTLTAKFSSIKADQSIDLTASSN